MALTRGTGSRLAVQTTTIAGEIVDIPAFVAVDASGNTGPVLPSAGLYADRSGTITTGGVAQTVAVANASRIGMTFQNTSDTVMRVTENGADATAATGYLVGAGLGINVSTADKVSVFCATTGKTYASTEY